VKQVLSQVAIVVRDFTAMQAKLKETISELYQAAKVAASPAAEEIPETIALLEWLGGDRFVFLGIRDYERVINRGDEVDLVSDEKSGLGVLRDPDVRVLRRQGEFVSVTPAVVAFLEEPTPIIITKANVKSSVHRRVYMDYIGVKRYGA